VIGAARIRHGEADAHHVGKWHRLAPSLIGGMLFGVIVNARGLHDRRRRRRDAPELWR